MNKPLTHLNEKLLLQLELQFANKEAIEISEKN